MTATLGILSDALEQRTRAVDRTADLIVEAVVPVRESVKKTKADWDGGTGAGHTTLVEGGARLTGALGGLVSQADHDDYLENINRGLGTFAAVMIRWAGTESNNLAVHRIKAHLHPRVNGANPQDVARWRARLYAVSTVMGVVSTQIPFSLVGTFKLGLIPLSDYVDVTAGAAEGDVTFDFGAAGRKLPLPKLVKPRPLNDRLWWISASGQPFHEFTVPVTILTIEGLTDKGEKAANIGLGIDTTQDTEPPSGSGNRLSTRSLSAVITNAVFGDLNDLGTAGGAPDLSVETDSFTAATVTFDQAGNQLDLGGTPTETVEFLAKAETPAGTSVTFEVRNDADSAWLPFQDGQTNVEVGVSKRQTYKVRVTLTPDAGGDVTPVVREIGIREIKRVSFENVLAGIQGGSRSIDPATLRGEISEAVISLVRDGERDYYDAVTSLLAEHHVGEILLEVWWGAADLDRADWFHIDSFVLEDYDPKAATIDLTCVSPASQLRQAFPVPQFLTTSGASLTFVAKSGDTPAKITRAAGSFVNDGYQGNDLVTIAGSSSNNKTVVVASVAALTVELDIEETLTAEGPTSAPTLNAAVRRPYQQTNASLKTVYDDLLDALAVPARHRGPGVEDATTTVGNTITDSDAKRELDAIAGIAGGGVITARGRLTFRSLFDATAAVAVFPSEEIQMLRTQPGLRYRVPELVVNYNWDETEGRFRSQVRAINTTGLTALGNAYIEPKEAPDEMGRWIRTTALAQTIGDRAVRYQGTGLMVWQFRANYPHPELLPGHLVAVETDQFVARDPFTAAAIRGQLWALAMIIAVEDLAGTVFTVWVRQFADLLPSYTSLDLNPLFGLGVEAYFTDLPGNPGQLQVRLLTNHFGATIKYVVQDLGAAVPDYGDAAYTTYSTPFNVTQLKTLDRQLSFYADRNGVRSAIKTVRIDKDTEPEVTLSIVQIDADTARFQVIADDDVVAWDLYQQVHATNYPTTTGVATTGTLLSSAYIGRLEVRADGKSKAAAGGDLTNVIDPSGNRQTGIGGTKWEKDGYANGNVIRAIAVPVDRFGNQGGRSPATLTMGASGGPALSAFSAAFLSAGSSCASPAQIRVSWTPNGSVTSSHLLRIYRRRDGGGWSLVQTVGDPSSTGTTQYDDSVESFQLTGSGLWINWEYRYELAADAAPGTVLDSGQSEVVSIESGECPLS